MSEPVGDHAARGKHRRRATRMDSGSGWLRENIPASAPRGKAAEHLRVDTNVPYDGYLILRLRSYPAWQVRVNGRPLSTLPERADGLIAVPVQEGTDCVTVDWTATKDTWIGRWLSACALVLLVGLWWIEGKLAPARLS